jgi:hypothetical protein
MAYVLRPSVAGFQHHDISSKDADVNSQYDVQGMYVGTALDAAVYHNHLHVVQLLLDSGALTKRARTVRIPSLQLASEAARWPG